MLKKLLVILSVVGLVSFNALAAAPEVRIGTQSTVGLNSLAIAKGFLKEEIEKTGAKVKILGFDSGKDINAAFAAKSIDFGYLGVTPFIIGAVSGLDVAYFRLDFINYDNEGLAAKKGKFKSIQDIKGQKIAVPFGTSAHFALLQTLRLNNISPKEVKILDIPAASIPATWERGDVDLAVVWELILSNLKDKVLLYTDKNLADNGVILADGLAVRGEFAKQHPQIVKAYNVALDRAYEFNEQNPKEAAAIIAKHFGLSEESATFQLSPTSLKLISTSELAKSNLFGTKENKGEFYKSLYQVAEFLKSQNLIRKLPSEDTFKNFIIY